MLDAIAPNINPIATGFPKINHKTAATKIPTTNTDLNCLFKNAFDPSRIALAISTISGVPSGDFLTFARSINANTTDAIEVIIAKISIDIEPIIQINPKRGILTYKLL